MNSDKESPAPIADKGKVDKFAKPYRFQCQHCGRCCSEKGTIVNVTFHDVLRMQKRLKYDFKKLLGVLGFYVFPEKPEEKQLEKMIVPPISTERGPAFLGLRKDESGKCTFLGDDNRCTIYAARPNICRTFPFNFHSIPEKKPKPHLRIQMQYTAKAMRYCPGIGTPRPIVKPKSWMTIGQKTVVNILEEIVLIKKYNKAVEKKEITSTADNYLRIVLEMGKIKKPAAKPAKGLSYKSRIRNKLEKKKL